MIARLTAAWERWDEWCARTQRSPWRVSKHRHIPDEDARIAAERVAALREAAKALQVNPRLLHERIALHRRRGLSVAEAVARSLR